MTNVSKNKKIVVGMSGGVDSSMALVLLKQLGWQPIGVSLKYAVWQNSHNLLRENVCCSRESFNIAKDVCQRLDVPYHILDVSREFKKVVIDYFTDELKNNRTPNPCIICNRHLKFKKLFEWAAANNIKYVATGHYARIKQNTRTKEYELTKAADTNKDQTYSLCFLPREWLKNIVLPLGKYIKPQIYQMAKDEGFPVFLKRKESQNFCFVAGGSMKCFLEKELGINKGNIENTRGINLGEHNGLHFFTIGQRKGLQLPNGPYFVKAINSKSNTLIVTKDEKELYRQEATLSPFNNLREENALKNIKVTAKVRYQQPLAPATLKQVSRNKLKLKFDQPQKAITPGQFGVFYQGEVCLGGGKICNTAVID